MKISLTTRSILLIVLIKQRNHSSFVQLYSHARLDSLEKGELRKTGIGIYADGMVEHDGHVGQLLKNSMILRSLIIQS